MQWCNVSLLDLSAAFDTIIMIIYFAKNRNSLSYEACSTIIHALISCRFDYYNYIMYNVPRSKTDRLQRLQNQCTPLDKIAA